MNLDRQTSLWAGALACLVAASVAQAHGHKADNGTEKCAGIVKAAHYESGTAKHDCGGQARADGLQDEWIALPKGLCKRIVGSTVLN